MGVEAPEFQVGDDCYRYDPSWPQLPSGLVLHEAAGVAVTADRVYVLTRNPGNPVVVLSLDGRLDATFGEGVIGALAHGISATPDGNLLCADVGRHCVTRWAPDGRLLQTLGVPDEPSAKWSGEPFNMPTHAVMSPQSGDTFVADGYGNSVIHRFRPDGSLKLSWGSPGIEPGHFIHPHNLAIDGDGRVFVADRECHRVQVFDEEGRLHQVLPNLHRADGLCFTSTGDLVVSELCSKEVDAPGVGHRISVLSGGEVVGTIGDPVQGSGPGQFVAPHGVATDGQDAIYVADTSFTMRGRHLSPPRTLPTISKFRRIGYQP